MSFQYVDRITEFVSGKSIRGQKYVTRNEPFFYWLPDGRRALGTGVISESLAQLGGWLCMASLDFKRRAVPVLDEMTEYFAIVEPGSILDLEVEFVEFESDVLISKSRCRVNGEIVLSARSCRAVTLPMEEFDDENSVRSLFNGLCQTRRLPREPAIGRPLKAIAGRSVFEGLSFIDGIISYEPYRKVVAYKNVTSCETYFRAHFPWKPVVPGVMLLSFMGEVCQYLVRDRIDAPVRSKALIPLYSQEVRLRKFVQPGDQLIISVELMSGNLHQNQQDIVAQIHVSANDTRVAQAILGFQTMFF